MEDTGQSAEKCGQVWSRLAVKLFNESTNVAYRWKAHFIGYPSTYKSPYLVSQIRQFLRFKQDSAWKTLLKVNRKLWSIWSRLAVKPFNQSTIVAYRWKAHFIGYPSTYKSPYFVSQIRQFLRFKQINGQNFGEVWSVLTAKLFNQSNNAAYRWKAHSICYIHQHIKVSLSVK